MCTPAANRVGKYAQLVKCNGTNTRKCVPRFQFCYPKMSFRNEVVWPIHLKGVVKYQCPDFPWHATLDVPRPWFFLTRRDIGVRNMTPFDTSRSLTRRVPIYDSPGVVEYHGPVNSTKLLISRSAEDWSQPTLCFISITTLLVLDRLLLLYIVIL